MSKLDGILFINRFPSIDLHGYDSMCAKVAINDFIDENIKLKNEIIVIIHGIGRGILRKACNEVLEKNRKVLEYKSYYYNNGCTVVALNLNEKRAKN